MDEDAQLAWELHQQFHAEYKDIEERDHQFALKLSYENEVASDKHGDRQLAEQLARAPFIDIDAELALSLSHEPEYSQSTTNHVPTKSCLESTFDIRTYVNQLKLSDDTLDVHELFVNFDKTFFNGTLGSVEVKWSSRMTLCAGLCEYRGPAGACTIKLSEPLLKFRCKADMIETLLHEMIHAYLFIVDQNRERDSHGPKFKGIMKTINDAAGTGITVFHTFHDEVDYHRKHWWKCTGRCKERPPYFGIVKRAMNRAPSKNDTWWAEHQLTCGGTFEKFKTPSNYKSKKRKT